MIVIDKPMLKFLLSGSGTVKGRLKGTRGADVGAECYVYIERREPILDRYGTPKIRRDGEPALRVVHIRQPYRVRIVELDGARALVKTTETVRYLPARMPSDYVLSPARAARTADDLPEEAVDLDWLERHAKASFERDHAMRAHRMAVEAREKSLARLARKRAVSTSVRTGILDSPVPLTGNQRQG